MDLMFIYHIEHPGNKEKNLKIFRVIILILSAKQFTCLTKMMNS